MREEALRLVGKDECHLFIFRYSALILVHREKSQGGELSEQIESLHKKAECVKQVIRIAN